MAGGSDPPPPTPTEVALQQAQIDALNAQNESLARMQREQNLLTPVLLNDLGFDAELDPTTGEIIGFNEREKTEDELALEEIERLSAERALAALKGELPVDPALLKDLEERRVALDESLRQDFGSLSAGRTSTPGMERIADFDEFEAATLDAARRGDLTMATDLALQTGAFNTNQSLAALGVVSGNSTQLNAPGTLSFDSILDNMAAERNNQFLAEEEQRQSSNNTKVGAITSGATIGGTIGSAFSPIGTAVGAGVGAGFGALASSNA